MKWLNCHRKKVVLVGIVAAIVFGGGNANADYIFGTPTSIGWGPSSSPSVSTDHLSLYVTSFGFGFGDFDIWVHTRETIHDDWPDPVNLGPTINTTRSDEGHADISADGLTLFFVSRRPGGHGYADIWLTTRPTTDEPWSEPVNLGPTINGPYWDSGPSVSTDGLSLFFRSDRPGGYGDSDIWVSTRETINDPWSEPANLGPIVNSPSGDFAPDISSDGLKLLFDSGRPGGHGGRDIWLTRRTTIDAPWSEPVNLGPIVNTSPLDWRACISADDSILYFCSDRPGGVVGAWDLWQASVIPIVDFNGDGIVDCADMCIMVDHWGEYYPLCDIGPTPLGDGIVDVQDLTVLAEHLFEDMNDPTW
jgi:hypothetical protein